VSAPDEKAEGPWRSVFDPTLSAGSARLLGSWEAWNRQRQGGRRVKAGLACCCSQATSFRTLGWMWLRPSWAGPLRPHPAAGYPQTGQEMGRAVIATPAPAIGLAAGAVPCAHVGLPGSTTECRSCAGAMVAPGGRSRDLARLCGVLRSLALQVRSRAQFAATGR